MPIRLVSLVSDLRRLARQEQYKPLVLALNNAANIIEALNKELDEKEASTWSDDDSPEYESGYGVR